MVGSGQFIKNISIVVFCVSFGTSSIAFSAENTPDFTGVWLAFASEPAFIRTATQTLSAEGSAKVEAFLAQYKNYVTGQLLRTPWHAFNHDFHSRLSH